MGVVSAHATQDLDTKTVDLSAKRRVQGRWRLIHFLSVLVAEMANNQLPPCTFSATGVLEAMGVTPVKRHPLQDFRPEMGVGVCPRVGLYLELYDVIIEILMYCG